MSTKWSTLQPRMLRYRSHHKFFMMIAGCLVPMVCAFWFWKSSEATFSLKDHSVEFAVTCAFFFTLFCTYLFWIRPHFKRFVQVYEGHLTIRNGKASMDIPYAEIESVGTVYWSLFYVKMSSGIKHYFSSSLERADYIWDRLHEVRPELFEVKSFEAFRLKLVQYDHHQKRKEWFFRHKMVDVFNWGVLPVFFLVGAFLYQSKEVAIHHPGLYFFRLFMYSLLVLLFTAFLYSMVLKKFVFDRRIKQQMTEKPEDKLRDLEFEGMVIQRSKIFQVITACFLFAFVVIQNINLYSVTRIREDVEPFHLNKGAAILVDNRFNCLDCRYKIADGDLIVFGKGYIGQVLAREGEMVGEIAQDKTGRMIASTNVLEVPAGHVAVKAGNNKDIVFVKIEELIGKIQK